jgi:hypothetical protein
MSQQGLVFYNELGLVNRMTQNLDKLWQLLTLFNIVAINFTPRRKGNFYVKNSLTNLFGHH